MIPYNTAIVLMGAAALGAAAGLVGCFLLLRRRALIGDAVAHAALPGLAGAFLIGVAFGAEGRSLPLMLAGAAFSGWLGLLTIEFLVRRTRLTEDAAIGAVLSVFFGVGVVLLSVIQAMPVAGAAGLKGFLFGQTAAMRAGEAAGLAGLAVLAALVVILCFKELRLIAFDPGFAAVQGWPVGRIDVILMALVLLITVTGMQTVGLVMIVALLITPAAAARYWTEDLRVMLAVAALIGATSGVAGAAISARFADLPTGATVVLTASALFALSLILGPSRGLAARAYRRASLREGRA